MDKPIITSAVDALGIIKETASKIHRLRLAAAIHAVEVPPFRISLDGEENNLVKTRDDLLREANFAHLMSCANVIGGARHMDWIVWILKIDGTIIGVADQSQSGIWSMEPWDSFQKRAPDIFKQDITWIRA